MRMLIFVWADRRGWEGAIFLAPGLYPLETGERGNYTK